MPRKKSKNPKWLTGFLVVMGAAALLFAAYIFFLFQESRKDSFVTYREFGIPMPTHYGIHGIDVSRYQQRISWPAVKAMNVHGIRLDFAFIKATEGTNRVDPF